MKIKLILSICFEQNLSEVPLTREQSGLVGKGCAGPPVDLDGIELTSNQVLLNYDFICSKNNHISCFQNKFAYIHCCLTIVFELCFGVWGLM